MTQHTAPWPVGASSPSSVRALQGIDHGYVGRPARVRDGAASPARRLALWKWSPREILHRGGTITRDDERAYRDLQAAFDRAEGE